MITLGTHVVVVPNTLKAKKSVMKQKHAYKIANLKEHPSVSNSVLERIIESNKLKNVADILGDNEQLVHTDVDQHKKIIKQELQKVQSEVVAA